MATEATVCGVTIPVLARMLAEWKQAGVSSDVFSRLMEAEMRLSLLEWREITAESLPKVGCEVTKENHSFGGIMKYGKREVLAVEALCDFPQLDVKDYSDNGWTHFRPINPPTDKEKDGAVGV